jgi:hypothetical protein
MSLSLLLEVCIRGRNHELESKVDRFSCLDCYVIGQRKCPSNTAKYSAFARAPFHNSELSCSVLRGILTPPPPPHPPRVPLHFSSSKNRTPPHSATGQPRGRRPASGGRPHRRHPHRRRRPLRCRYLPSSALPSFSPSPC